jgi:hypothetical protein
MLIYLEIWEIHILRNNAVIKGFLSFSIVEFGAQAVAPFYWNHQFLSSTPRRERNFLITY